MYFGAFRSRAEAETQIAKLKAREMHGANWARRYHDRGFVVREAVVETRFAPTDDPATSGRAPRGVDSA
jgi:hypothetical protein